MRLNDDCCLTLPLKTKLMKILFLCIGKTQYSFLQQGELEYINRLKHYIKIDYVTIADIKNTKSLSIEEVKKREGELFLTKIATNDFVILLDEGGKMYSSLNFAYFIKKNMILSKRIVFVVGGSYGFSPAVYLRANHMISLSPMTFSHQMIRMFFFEQLYRATTILENHPYHHK